MRYLLDTNVISQITKDRPNEQVIRWLDDQDEDDAEEDAVQHDEQHATGAFITMRETEKHR